jgi:hypothetical protein
MRELNPGDYVIALGLSARKAAKVHALNSETDLIVAFEAMRDGIISCLGLLAITKEDLDKIVSEHREQGRDYSALDTSAYILRVEVCLEFIRRFIVTGDRLQDARNWLIDMYNHVDSFLAKKGTNETSNLSALFWPQRCLHLPRNQESGD